jgi:hypothetical protein
MGAAGCYESLRNLTYRVADSEFSDRSQETASSKRPLGLNVRVLGVGPWNIEAGPEAVVCLLDNLEIVR